ncbi:hypothetical protein RIF29_30339 [Crotalaria pallida]|uniref:PB1-like domain-containing protein n=1 Tax=Crotalaria pallida TaxID=3830 RepID=A0AAN9HWM5_CROPI
MNTELPGGMENYFRVHVHHGGHSVSGNRSLYLGHVSLWNCDPDRWSFFEVFDIAKEMNYEEVETIWYKDLDNNIQHIVDDEGAGEVANIAMAKGSAHLYLLHPVSQPVPVGMLPASGPENNDYEVVETEENGRRIIDLTCNGPEGDTGPQEEVSGVQINETVHVAQGNEANTMGQGNEASNCHAPIVEEDEEQGEEEVEKNDDSALKVRFDDFDDEDIEKDFFDTATSKATKPNAPEPMQADASTTAPEPMQGDAVTGLEPANVSTNPQANESTNPEANASTYPQANAGQSVAAGTQLPTPTNPNADQSAAAAATEGESTERKKRGRPPNRPATSSGVDEFPFNIKDEDDWLRFDLDCEESEKEVEPDLDRFSEAEYNSSELESEEDTDEEEDAIKPIVTMIDELRIYLMERWETNRSKIANYDGSVLPRIKIKLDKEKELTNNWLVRYVN